MDIENYLNYLDDLTDRERTVFLYRIVLKLTIQQTANHLKAKPEEISRLSKMLKEQQELLHIKSFLYESFQIIGLV